MLKYLVDKKNIHLDLSCVQLEPFNVFFRHDFWFQFFNDQVIFSFGIIEFSGKSATSIHGRPTFKNKKNVIKSMKNE